MHQWWHGIKSCIFLVLPDYRSWTGNDHNNFLMSPWLLLPHRDSKRLEGGHWILPRAHELLLSYLFSSFSFVYLYYQIEGNALALEKVFYSELRSGCRRWLCHKLATCTWYGNIVNLQKVQKIVNVMID